MFVSSYSYICVLIQLHMYPHTATYVSSYSYICVLIQLIRSAKKGEDEDEESEKEKVKDVLQQHVLDRAGKYLTNDLRATAAGKPPASRGSNRRREPSVAAPGLYSGAMPRENVFSKAPVFVKAPGIY